MPIKKFFSTTSGFTLIELLVVISIIGLLSSIVLASLNTARAKARNAQRLSDMHQIQIALELYYDKYGTYPTVGAARDTGAFDFGGWDTTADGIFLQYLVSEGFLPKMPLDPSGSTVVGSGYRYYFYKTEYNTSYGCAKPFYALGVLDMENSSGVYPGSPGFSCGTYSLGTEWATGKFVP
jgi:prepilin-type N-terminal cleavage/methylation domain-containing protein